MHTVHNLPFELASGNLDQSDAAPTYVEASARQEQNTSQSAQLDIKGIVQQILRGVNTKLK
jgi:hypothetical protein